MKRRKLTILIIIFMLLVSSVFPAYAESFESTNAESAENISSESSDMEDVIDNFEQNTDIEQGSNHEQDIFPVQEDDPELDKNIERSALEGNDIMLLTLPEEKEIKAYGVDVSVHNGAIDWQTVKAAGVDFAIIRVGYRGYTEGKLHEDTMAKANLKGAQEAGIKIGAYFYSTAVTEAEAIEEAKFTVEIIKDYKITYPVVYDCEGYDNPEYRNYYKKCGKTARTDNALAFLEYVESCGYKGMMYSSASHFSDESYWETSRLDPYYDIWVAQYWYWKYECVLDEETEEYKDVFYQYPSYEELGNRLTSYSGIYRMWQFSEQGTVDGINGYVDLDIEYYTEDEASQQQVKVNAMYRLYNPYTSEHFYTADVNEKDHLSDVGWSYEGIAWYAPEEGDPVYRLYNPYVSDHHYTLSANERDHLVEVGWSYEGIGWYSDQNKYVKVYRLYNPYTVTGMHHYTTDYSEVRYLSSIGWQDEGIGWYGGQEDQ